MPEKAVMLRGAWEVYNIFVLQLGMLIANFV